MFGGLFGALGPGAFGGGSSGGNGPMAHIAQRILGGGGGAPPSPGMRPFGGGAPAPGMRPVGPAPMPTFGQGYQNPMQQQVAKQAAPPGFFDRLRNNPQALNMGLGMLQGRQQGLNVGQMLPQIMSLWNGGR